MVILSNTLLSLYQKPFIHHLNLIATSLIVSSFIYLIASNWFGLSPAIRLAIPMILLFLSGLASFFILKKEHINHQTLIVNTLHTICCTMIGLSLASIGQIYQTGADAYSLFALWSILSLLWLYRHNSAVFIIFVVLSQLSLYLFFKQSFIGVDSYYYAIAIHTLTGIQLFLTLKYYTVARWLLASMIAMIGTYYAIEFTSFHYNKNLINFLSIFLLPSIASYYFYKLKYQGSMAIVSLSLGVSFFALFLDLMDISVDGFGGLIVYAMIAIGIFFTIGFWLLNLFPKGVFHYIPIVFGAWLGGLLTAFAFLIFWDKVSLLFGIIGLILSLIGLRKSHSLFLRQFLYTILIASQLSLLFYLQNEFHFSIFAIFIVQALLSLLCLLIKPHWFLMLCQLLLSYGLFIYATVFENQFSYNDPFNSSIVLFANQAIFLMALPILLFYRHKLNTVMTNSTRLLLLFVIGVIGITQISYFLVSEDISFIIRELQDANQTIPNIHQYLIKAIGICYTGILLLTLWAKNITKNNLIIMALLGMALSLLGYTELFVLMLGLFLTHYYKDKYLSYAYLIAIGLFLWQLYYRLDMLFLIKSLTIFISGLLCFLVAYFIKKQGEINVSTH